MLLCYFFFCLKDSKFYSFNNPIIKLYGIFVAVNLLSIFWSINLEVAFSKALTLIQIFFNSLIIFEILKTTKAKNILIIAFFACSFLNFLILMGPLESYSYYFVYGRFLGTTTNPNILALYMFFSIFGSLYFLKENNYNFNYNLFFVANIFISLYVISFTLSKKGFIFSVLIILVFLIQLLKFNRNNILLISKISFPILILCYVVFVRFDSEILTQNIYNISNRFESLQLLFKSEQLTYGSTADRLSFLKLGLSTFMDNPFFGVGSNNFVVLFPGTGYTHNNYIEILANLGIVGFLPFYLMYFVLIKKISKISNKSIRYFLLAFVALFLFKELALVTYYSKYLIIVMFWLYLTAEEKINENYLLSKNK